MSASVSRRTRSPLRLAVRSILGSATVLAFAVGVDVRTTSAQLGPNIGRAADAITESVSKPVNPAGRLTEIAELDRTASETARSPSHPVRSA